MSASARFLAMVLALGFGSSVAVAASHPVPKDRAALTNRDWLPHVVSKIAPLEWWSFATSSTEILRDDYQSDYRFDLAKLETLLSAFLLCLVPANAGNEVRTDGCGERV